MDVPLATSSYLLCSDHYLNKWYSLGPNLEDRGHGEGFSSVGWTALPFHKSFVSPEDHSSVEQLTKEWMDTAFVWEGTFSLSLCPFADVLIYFLSLCK